MTALDTEAARIAALADRVEAAAGSDNALDVLVEIALFEPEPEGATAIRANDAGTKVIYTLCDGSETTHWANDWTFGAAARSDSAAALRARSILQQGEASDGQ